MDGQQQRRALSAAEPSLTRLAEPDSGNNASSAANDGEALDPVSPFAGLTAAVEQAAGEIARSGRISAAPRSRLTAIVGAGHLDPLVGRIPGP